MKVIISCAITGAIHTPTMSDALPITPAQIEEESVAAAEAGAAILHLHARNPETGRPTGVPDVFARFLPGIARRSDAVLNITTGGSPSMPVKERLAAATQFAPEICSLNMGSMNFGLYPLADRYSQWKHDWEERIFTRRTTSSSGTAFATSAIFWSGWAISAPNSSTSATTLGISTRSPTSLIAS